MRFLSFRNTVKVKIVTLLSGLYVYQFIDAIMTANAINRKALRGEEVDEVKVEELPEFV